MSEDAHYWRMKAQAYTTALSKLTAKERDKIPTPIFINDFNALRQGVIALKPPFINQMPPAISVPVRVTDPAPTYGEIHTYAETINNLLLSMEVNAF